MTKQTIKITLVALFKIIHIQLEESDYKMLYV